jgi:hypothetical protein
MSKTNVDEESFGKDDAIEWEAVIARLLETSPTLRKAMLMIVNNDPSGTFDIGYNSEDELKGEARIGLYLSSLPGSEFDMTLNKIDRSDSSAALPLLESDWWDDMGYGNDMSIDLMLGTFIHEVAHVIQSQHEYLFGQKYTVADGEGEGHFNDEGGTDFDARRFMDDIRDEASEYDIRVQT